MESLEDLLEAARSAGPTRISYRDRIATHGKLAVERLAPWVGDPALGGVAVRTIGAAAMHQAKSEAVAALVVAARTCATENICRDAEAELRKLGAARALMDSGGPTIRERGVLPDGRRFIRFLVQAQGAGGHFTVPQVIMTELGLPIDASVELRVAGVEANYRGTIALKSRNEVYWRLTDQETRGLEKIQPYELIEVTIAPAQPGS